LLANKLAFAQVDILGFKAHLTQLLAVPRHRVDLYFSDESLVVYCLEQYRVVKDGAVFIDLDLRTIFLHPHYRPGMVLQFSLTDELGKLLGPLDAPLL
jgi:hypothetical protein